MHTSKKLTVEELRCRAAVLQNCLCDPVTVCLETIVPVLCLLQLLHNSAQLFCRHILQHICWL